jgi:hypothetical protein
MELISGSYPHVVVAQHVIILVSTKIPIILFPTLQLHAESLEASGKSNCDSPISSMASLIAPSRANLLAKATQASSSTALPSFLLPAWQQQPGAAHRHFSTTPLQCSKLGRTPLAIPPGVEILMSDLKTVGSATSWKPSKHRTITVNGPLG